MASPTDAITQTAASQVRYDPNNPFNVGVAGTGNFGGAAAVNAPPATPKVNQPPASPVSVVTAQPAIKDYNNIQSEVQRIQEGVASQSTAKMSAEMERAKAATDAMPNLAELKPGGTVTLITGTYKKMPDGSFQLVSPPNADSTATGNTATAGVATPTKTTEELTNDVLRKLYPNEYPEAPGAVSVAAGGDAGAQAGGALANALKPYWQQQDENFAKYQNDIENIRNGTFPLTADQQAQVDTMKASFERLRQMQVVANKNYEGGVTQAGIAAGRSRYAPELELGNVANAVNVGIQKLSEIEQNAVSSLAQLRQAFQDKNYDRVTKLYDATSNFLKSKEDTITGLTKYMAEQEKDARNFDYQAKQDYADNIFRDQHFTFEQKTQAFNEAMKSAEFDANQKQRMKDNYYKEQELQMKQKELNAKLTAGTTPGDLSTAQLAAEEFASTGKMPSWVTKEQVPLVALLSRSVVQPAGKLVDSITGMPKPGLPAARVDGIIALSDTIKKLETAKAAFGEIHTGLLGKLGDLNPSDERVLYDSLKDEITSLLVKARSGSAVSDSEYGRYVKKLPGDWNNFLFMGADGVDKIENLKQSLIGNLNTALQTDGVKIMGGADTKNMSDDDLFKSAIGNSGAGNTDPASYFNNLLNQLNTTPQ